MPNEEILKYIKDCLSHNYTKEQIKQSLREVGWENSQIEEALLSVQVDAVNTSSLQPKEATPVIKSYVPEEIITQSVPSKSILPLAIMAGTAVVIMGIGVTLWILTKSNTNSNQLATEQTAPVKATTTVQNSQLAQQTEVKSATSTGAQLSEIDKYGVDLYALKQGETVTEKTLGGVKIKVVYTRTGDEIERKSAEIDVSGGKTTTAVSISLNSKKKLLAGIKEMEVGIATDCKNISTKECIDGKTILDYLKTKCTVLQRNEEISMCMIAAAMSPATTQLLNANSPKSTVDQYGIDLLKLPEGKTVKVFKNPATDEVPYGNTTTVTYERSGDAVTISESILYDGGRGVSNYKTTISLK